MSVLFTVGHSTHRIDVFVGLLKQHGITALVDVRSYPYSRHCPQYSQSALKVALAREQIAYVFLGKELGARSETPACYRQGKVQYDLLAKEPEFAVGLDRLHMGMERFRIALMCAEKDPLDCHRAVLVARRVYEAGVPVEHIRADGRLEKHAEMEARMLNLLNMSDADMFRSRDEILVDAYRLRGEQIAYEDDAMLQEEIGDRKLA
jgi:uncharacterized protein (DUF488 family)